MELAKIIVKETTGKCILYKRIPAGIVGATVSVEFVSPVWANLQKTVVFRGAETRIAEFDGEVVTVPHEVVATPGLGLFFGIWGYDPDSGLQLPLIEIRMGTIEDATDPEADPGTDPTLPIWAQLQKDIEELKKGGVSDEQIAQAVEDYLTDHPVEGGYPTTTEITDKSTDKEVPTAAAVWRYVASDLEKYYTKNQSYSREEVDQKVSAIPKFAIKVVSVLPTNDISNTTVYLLKSGSNDDLYTEYIFVDDSWEILGSQRVDLTGYATEQWVEEKLEEHSGGNGADGFSPIATVKQTDEGAVISITDANGTTRATISNGEDGEPGKPGVWTGSNPPPDESYTVWVDPSGDASGTEDWVFTLVDGSSVTKKVVVL